MNLKLPVLLAAFSIALSLQAQEVALKGRVVSDKDNQPIQNVTVGVLNSDISTTSDRFGSFELTVASNAVLVFSKEGFTDHQLPIADQSQISVTLKHTNLISVGYQELPKNEMTGAVASVQQQDFNTGLINSPEQLMQGKAAGVQVTMGSGEPGSNVYTYVRGLSSINGPTPLFVIDGFPLSQDDVYGTSSNLGRGTSSVRDPLNFISPGDVERVDILKDASATAIYGSRGSHGVVFIKTKNGVGEKNQLQFTSQVSLSNQRKYYDLLNREQFLDGIADRGGDTSSLDFGGNTDWQKEVNQKAFSQKYDLAYSSSYKSGNYRASLGYETQPGIIKESGLNRITGRLNWRHALLNNKLQLTANLSASTIQDQYALITNNAGFEGDLLGSVYTANPTWQNDPDIQPPSFTLNPLSIQKYYHDESKTNRSLMNISLNYAVTDHFSINVNAGMDQADATREVAISPELYLLNGTFENGRASSKKLETNNDLLETRLRYDKTFGRSRINAIAGYAYQKFSQNKRDTQGWGFTNSGFTDIMEDLNSAAGEIRSVITQGYEQFGYSEDTFFITQLSPTPQTIDLTSVKPTVPVSSVTEEMGSMEDEQQSFFGRVNYSYQSKYFVTASIRVDGSTLFGANNKYGIFPAVSASWKLSEETFVSDFFSDLNVRVGFGISGNQNIPHNASKEYVQFQPLTIGFDGSIPNPSLSSTSINNPDLQWEQTSEVNVGVDFGIFENKLRGNLDIYRKATNNFLYTAQIPQPAPVAFALINADGQIINRGVELALYLDALSKKNLDVTMSFNIAYNSNTVKNFNGEVDAGQVFGQGLTGAFVQRVQNNQPLYAYYVREFVGFDDSGYSVYNDDYQKFTGEDPVPNVVLGFGANVKYRNWYAQIFLNGLLGYHMYSNTANAYFTAGSLMNGRNVITAVLTNGESPVNAPEVSTRFLERADFIRLQNATVGYNFYFDKRPFKTIRAYLTGQNLFVLTGYSGLDPDVNNGRIGIDYSTYPTSRIFTLGLQVTF
jgi:TonB-dependent starch-binding outer membrane protein SusC